MATQNENKPLVWFRPLVNVLVTGVLCGTIIVLARQNPNVTSILDAKILLALVVAALWTHSGRDQLRGMIQKSLGANNEKK